MSLDLNGVTGWHYLSAMVLGRSDFSNCCDILVRQKTAWDASLTDLQAAGIGEKMAVDLLDFRKKFSLEEYGEKMRKVSVSFYTLRDEEYPELLKQIKNPPIILYKKGTYIFNKNYIFVSVVGTRKVTDYGKDVTGLLVSDLITAGCVIVSGLAMGVDAVAASAAIAAGGKTIAVLGSGVDLCTPAENSSLYNSILKSGGAIISENPLGMTPNKGSFPARNRIIAGLSLGVLVNEGAADRGRLITANDAFNNNRKVFAVPGPITSSVSQGPISLITKGAKMVITVKDILDELGIKGMGKSKKSRGLKGETKEEQRILDLLQDENLPFDEIIKRTGFSSSQLGTLLSLMEVKGVVKSLEAGFFGLTT